jgi:hypothetical protein
MIFFKKTTFVVVSFVIHTYSIFAFLDEEIFGDSYQLNGHISGIYNDFFLLI